MGRGMGFDSVKRERERERKEIAGFITNEGCIEKKSTSKSSMRRPVNQIAGSGEQK